MTTNKETFGTIHPMYAVAMSDAIASGDAAQLSAAREAAFSHLAAAADVARLLPELESAIKSKGGVIRPLYAVTIQDAVARGDAVEIARLKTELTTYNNLLGGASAFHPVTPYGVAIQDAQARGDHAEVDRLKAYAQSLLAQLNVGK
ncbi:DUF1843 domain-containing protein [Undibacterium sp. JH2W]|uniref:DUF1843 domain-containing protein n=1 Tax=Undibacterium sp. JH2W TaxID=3413037 RepID=UPI003BF325C4